MIKSVIDDNYPLFSGLAPTALPEYEDGLEEERSEAHSKLEQRRKNSMCPPSQQRPRRSGPRASEPSDDVDLIVVGSRRWGLVARVVTGGVGETLGGRRRVCGRDRPPPSEEP